MTQQAHNVDIPSAVKDTRLHLAGLPFFDRFWFWFWLAGPFIFLIERSPADLWITLLNLAFLWRCFRRNDWGWMRQRWVQAIFGFWAICLLSAIISALPAEALLEGAGWLRFPLYAMAAQVWFGQHRAFRVMMLAAMSAAMLMMTAILTAEVIFAPKARLSWPYGDLVPGGFLAKAVLPATVVWVALIIFEMRRRSMVLGGLLAWSLAISMMTGERMHMLIRGCASLLAMVSWRTSKMVIAAGAGLITALMGLLFWFVPSVNYRFGSYFVNDNPLLSLDSSYWSVWKMGIAGFQLDPVLGVGPGNLRHLCPSLPAELMVNPADCSNHPHHYYFQIAGETGAVGLIAAILMIGLILHHCWQARRPISGDKMICPMAATSYIVPLAIFFPLQSTGDFFGQWSNVFIWMGIGFAVMQNQSFRQDK